MFRDKIRVSYHEIFSSPAGELVLADLANYCRLFKSHPIKNEDAQRCEGLRSVMIYILDKIGNPGYKEVLDRQLNYDEQAYYDRILTTGNTNSYSDQH